MKINFKRAIISAVIIILIFTGAKFIFDIDAPAGTAGTIGVELNAGSVYRCFSFDNAALLVGGDGLLAVNNKGNHVWSVDEQYPNSIVQINNKYILYMKRGGREFSVYNGKKLVYRIETPENITGGKVNKNGYVALSSEEAGYNGMITVYNNKGNEVYKWHCGEGYIVDVDISPNNKEIIVAKMSSEGETVLSSAVFIDILKNEIITSEVKNDSLAVYARYNKDGSSLVLYDNSLTGYGRDRKEKYNVAFVSANLSSFNLDSENNMVLAFTNSKNITTLEMYSKDGKKRGTYHADGKVKNISVSGEVIACSQQRSILRISPNGNMRNTESLPYDIKELQLMPDRAHVLVIGGDKMEIIKL